jgi:Carboxypeptidase regulatory-like domain
MSLAKLLSLMPILAALSSAQTDTAGLIGLVTDASGGTVPNSKVRLKSRAIGAVREQATDAKGLYQFEVLAPGEYDLTVDAPGFKQFRGSQVRVPVAQISRLDAQLEVGSASDFVEV